MRCGDILGHFVFVFFCFFFPFPFFFLPPSQPPSPCTKVPLPYVETETACGERDIRPDPVGECGGVQIGNSIGPGSISGTPRLFFFFLLTLSIMRIPFVFEIGTRTPALRASTHYWRLYTDGQPAFVLYCAVLLCCCAAELLCCRAGLQNRHASRHDRGGGDEEEEEEEEGKKRLQIASYLAVRPKGERQSRPTNDLACRQRRLHRASRIRVEASSRRSKMGTEWPAIHPFITLRRGVAVGEGHSNSRRRVAASCLGCRTSVGCLKT